MPNFEMYYIITTTNDRKSWYIHQESGFLLHYLDKTLYRKMSVLLSQKSNPLEKVSPILLYN